MFGKRFSLFRLFGFEVRADAGWLVLAALITWTLAAGVFPSLHAGLTTGVYWVMGLAGAAGLFLSILLHEVSHAWVARRDGLQTRWITLWIFGGVAETVAEPHTAQSELRIALAGPICSIVLAAACWGIAIGCEILGVPIAIIGVVLYLSWTNAVLALFNLLPGFPLDGGRVLRALLWRIYGDVFRATRIATAAGIGFGILLMAAGVVFVLGGNPIGGIWWILIGSFLRRAAISSRQQMLLREALRGVPVRRIMDRHPLVVPPGLTMDRFVHEYAFARGRMRFPVGREDELVGFVDLPDLRGLGQEDWTNRPVEAFLRPITQDVLITADTDGAEALRRLQDGETPLLFVVDGDRLAGTLSLDDLLRSLAVRRAVEGWAPGRLRASETRP